MYLKATRRGPTAMKWPGQYLAPGSLVPESKILHQCPARVARTQHHYSHSLGLTITVYYSQLPTARGFSQVPKSPLCLGVNHPCPRSSLTPKTDGGWFKNVTAPSFPSGMTLWHLPNTSGGLSPAVPSGDPLNYNLRISFPP